MKDLEWLKEEVRIDIESLLWKNKIGAREANGLKGRVIHLIDQIEQPELPKTPDELKVNMQVGFEGGVEGYSNVTIPETVEILGEYDVTVQQPELPVIPKFVARLMEDYNDASIHSFLSDAFRNYREGRADRADTWITKNPADFVDAYRYGYTVEEKKYEVRGNDGQYFLGKINGYIKESYALPIGDGMYIKELTEQEIKDYDERYFAFAVPVEELEK